MRWFKRRRSGSEAVGAARAALTRAVVSALDDDLAAVEQRLLEVVSIDSRDVDAYRVLGRVCRDRGDVRRAVGIHRALVMRRDLDRQQRIDALVELGASLRVAGEARRAAAAFDEALVHDPDDARALRGLEELLAARGDHAQALVLTRRRGRAEGRRDRATEARRLADAARSLYGTGRADVARRVARRAVRRDAGVPEAHRILADLEASRGQDLRAVEHWTRAIELDGSLSGELIPRLEAAFTRLGRAGAWRGWLETRIDSAPEDAAAWSALARAFAATGDPEAGVAELRRRLRGRPDVLAGRVALGRLLVAEGPERGGVDAVKAYAELLDVLEARLLGEPDAAAPAPARAGEDA